MKLNGHFPNFLAAALVRKPGVTQVGAYQHQFQVLNYFDMVADDALGTGGIHDEVQLELLVVVQRKVELLFHARKQRETVALREGSYLPH